MNNPCSHCGTEFIKTDQQSIENGKIQHFECPNCGQHKIRVEGDGGNVTDERIEHKD